MASVWRAVAACAALIFPGPVRYCARGSSSLPVTWSNADFGRRLDLGGYALAFDDEFDRLRLTAAGGAGPWFAPIPTDMGVGRLMGPGDEVYRVDHGLLTLSTRQVAGRWREANMQTMDAAGRGFAFRDGYIEMRARLAPQPGAHGGLWLLSMNRGHGHVEVDVVETYGADSLSLHSASHLWPAAGAGRPTAASQATFFPRLYSGDHRFGLLATETLLISYVDGREVARIARLPSQRAPMYVLLSLFENAAAPVRTPAAMQVDYVRVYTPKTSKGDLGAFP